VNTLIIFKKFLCWENEVLQKWVQKMSKKKTNGQKMGYDRVLRQTFIYFVG